MAAPVFLGWWQALVYSIPCLWYFLAHYGPMPALVWTRVGLQSYSPTSLQACYCTTALWPYGLQLVTLCLQAYEPTTYNLMPQLWAYHRPQAQYLGHQQAHDTAPHFLWDWQATYCTWYKNLEPSSTFLYRWVMEKAAVWNFWSPLKAFVQLGDRQGYCTEFQTHAQVFCTIGQWTRPLYKLLNPPTRFCIPEMDKCSTITCSRHDTSVNGRPQPLLLFGQNVRPLYKTLDPPYIFPTTGNG